VTRSYGTRVYRLDGHYLKSAPRRGREDHRFQAEAEAERLSWLARQGIPVPEVVDVGADETHMWLVTREVPGVPAAGPWPADRLDRVIDAVAELVLALHGLPAARCPFDRTLRITLPAARHAVRTGTVDLADLEPRHRGWSAQDLQRELDATPAPEQEQLVVCHGDLCLDNVLLDPDTLAPTALLDVGRCGVADVWLDLAVAVRNIGEECTRWGYGPGHAARLLARCGRQPDPVREHYYRLLDEFI
jgi:kanamycin kinase